MVDSSGPSPPNDTTAANPTHPQQQHNSSSTDSGVGGSGSSSGEQTSGGLEGRMPAQMMTRMRMGGKMEEEEEEANNDGEEAQRPVVANGVRPNTFGTFSPLMGPSTAAASPSSAASSSMLSNVVGYARSRLFRHANDGLMPTAPIGAANCGGGGEKELGRRHPGIGPIIGGDGQSSQSARGTPVKKGGGGGGWEEAQKSCPVARRQFTAAIGRQQQNNGGGGGGGLDVLQRGRGTTGTDRDSVSIGSRESVTSGGGAGLGDSGATTGNAPSLCSSSRASWQNGGGGARQAVAKEKAATKGQDHWQLFAVTLHRATQGGFGIAISGGTSNSESGGGILVSDVIPSGPAFGLLQVGDSITSCNGYPLEHADYAGAVAVMKEAQQLNMIVKRRVPVPFVEFEQRTLKFTLSKSRKKDDFGIVLGCRFYIKEILNPKLAEKEPGLKEGDTVLRINGQSLDGASLEEASRLLQRSREKLSLVVQRDVRRNGGGGGCGSSRWPSQTTVYERLGSLQATPRQSPTPAHYGFAPRQQCPLPMDIGATIGRKGSAGASEYSTAVAASGYKRFSDPMTGSIQVDYCPTTAQTSACAGLQYGPAQQQQPMMMMMQMHNNGRPMLAGTTDPGQQLQQSQHCQSSPYLGNQRLVMAPQQHPASLQTRAQSQTPSSVQSLPIGSQPVHHQNAHSNSSAQSQSQFLPSEQYQMGGQRFVYQAASPQGQMPAQRPVRAVNFQKGPGGLGIRVIGGNQVGIFVSAVQEQSPADQNGIRVGDRIHAVNGVSIAGLTREEAFDILLSLGEQQIGLAVENCPEEFAQVKTGKFGDSFYIRAHFAHSKATPSRGHPPSQQPAELSFQPGDIFHVTDTLFGGSPGYWQVTKVYSAIDAEQQKPAGVGAGQEPNSGIVPHAKVAEQMLREQRMTAEKAANSNGGGMNGSAEGGGGTLSRSLFRKKLSLSSRKFFGGASNNAASASEPPMEEVLSANGNYGATAADLVPPAYERVALKRPAFHRPVVLFGPLADVARQHLLTQSSLRFGAPLPSTPSANAAEPMIASTSSERGGGAGGIRLCAVDAVMAAQKHCCLCVSPGSVERLQLAQYAPIVILVDVDSRSRVRELRSKAGAATQSARKLMEQAARIKKHHSHLLTATLDASKEDQWFEALRALIFHLQERRVWMPEFQPEQPLDDMLLFSLPGETPTSDGDKSDYGIYEPGPSLNNGGTNNGTGPRQYQQSAAAAVQQQSQQPQLMARMGGGGGHPNGGGGPFLVTNPAYSLAKQQQMQANNCAVAGNDHDDQHDGGGGQQQQQLPSSSRPAQQQQPAMMVNSATIDSVSLHHHQYQQHQNNSAARNSPYHPMGGGAVAQQRLSLYASPSNALSAATAAARASPREPTTKSQLLAQLATELGNGGGGGQQKGGIPQQ